MTALTFEELEVAVAQYGIGVERFPNSETIRLTPKKQCYLLSIPCGQDIPFSIKCLNCISDAFYCVGRERRFALPDTCETKHPHCVKLRYVQYPVSLTCDELCRIVNDTWQYRKGVADDFYAIPTTGTFMLYVSHHNEILLYFGWQDLNNDKQNK